MEQRVTIITLGVRDLKASTRFYTDQFGWEKAPMSNDHITFYKLNGMLLSLYPLQALAEDTGVESRSVCPGGCTLAYNTHSREEVDQLVQRLGARGVQVVKQPREVFWGGYSSYVSDPDGHLWEIAYNPFLPMDKNGNIETG